MASKDKTGLKRKRRPVDECPNPLFVKWVEEWRDEAREEGSKVQYAYAKALNSLKKYPLPLQSGQEAKILDNIGEVLSKKLDKRLSQYRAERAVVVKGSASNRAPEKTNSPVKTKRKRPEYIPEYKSGPYALIIALYQAQQSPCWIGHLSKNQLMTQAQPFCDKSFTIPDDGKYYTAWSSMTTLIRKGFVDKRSCPAKFSLTESGEEMAERLERATSSLASSSSLSPTNTQSTSPSSSSSSSIPYKHSTASSSSSLSHCPVDHPRPSKTPRVSQTHNHTTRNSISPSSTSYPLSPLNPPPPTTTRAPVHPMISGGPTISLISDSDDDDDVEELSPLVNRIQNKLVTTPPHVLPNVGSENVCVMETPQPTLYDDSGGRGRGREGGGVTPAQMAGRAALLRLEKGVRKSDGGGGGGGGGGGKRGRVSSDDKLKEISCTVDLTVAESREDISVKKQLLKSLELEKEEKEKEEFPDYLPFTKRKLVKVDQFRHHTRLTSPPIKSPPAPSRHSLTLSPSSSPLSLSPSSTSSRHTLGDITSSVDHRSNKLQHQSPLGPPLFRLVPEDYEVVLCVDNAESTASRKSSSQFRGILLQELAKNGVRFDVRKLSVGDFLWIAREKSSPLPGQLTLPKSREIVLEYIVERKRMDDLAQSITDGRFNEQKFRMKQCGVRQPMYLVEEFSDKMHLKLPLRSLEQAISNTQVDGFIVHRTVDVRESVAYLTLMTRKLTQRYLGKTVEAQSWDTMAEWCKTQSSHLLKTSGDTARSTVQGVEFQSFNEASIKNKTLIASEMLGRHLMQCPAVSAERASLILDHFPTVTALRDAYRKCSTNAQREALISTLKTDQMSRSLGKSVGKLVCSLYWGR